MAARVFPSPARCDAVVIVLFLKSNLYEVKARSYDSYVKERLYKLKAMCRRSKHAE
jgi:hypothetical protein